MTDRKYNVGDLVFVVPQRKRAQQSDPPGELTPIVKVGRKRCYIELHRNEVPFDPATGKSVHKECNTRANGYGFDVYESEAAYLKAVQERQDNARLAERLRRIATYGRVSLPPSAVAAILAILDQHERGAT